MRKVVKVLACLGTTLAAISVFSSPVIAGPISVTDTNLDPYTLPYGDFNIVSLQFADVGTNSKTAYYVASSPGQLLNDNAIVVGTGAGPNFANGKPMGASTITGIDAPY